MKRDQDHFRGCLLGGTIGDALGWPVEFLLLNEIKDKYGQQGTIDKPINNSKRCGGIMRVAPVGLNYFMKRKMRLKWR